MSMRKRARSAGAQIAETPNRAWVPAAIMERRA
jgi:hypothetical protein